MKFFVSKNQINNNKIEIIGSDVNHIKNVLRKKEKDNLSIVCKESNTNYIGEILDIGQDKVVLNIIKECDSNSESNVNIHIFQGLPKSDKMELIIQKCTELGVTDITPVIFKRSVVKIDEKDKDKKISRWNKIAEVAAKQSERDSILEVHNVISLKDINDYLEEKFDKIIVAYEKEKDCYIKNILINMKKKDNLKIAVIIGPEGGIDEEEIDLLKKNGAECITLGKRILRTETAPIVLSSIIMYELGDVGGI